MPDQVALQTEISENFDFLMRNLSSMLPRQAGRYALLKGRCVLDFFDDAYEADVAGSQMASDGVYSIQKVTAEPIELGAYSHGLG